MIRAMKKLSKLRINGLHLSDAIADFDVKKGTHLAIGCGNINFENILSYFKNDDIVYGALEIRSNSQGIRDSIRHLRKLIV